MSSAACRRGGRGSTRRRSGAARAAHQRVDRRAREVAVVLVVDRVELAVVDQVAHVRVLDRRRRRRRRAACDARRRSRSGRARGPSRCWRR